MSFELLAAVLGFVVAFTLLPIVIRWAREQSLLDMPDDFRRKHAAPTPRIGGVAILLAVPVTCTVVYALSQTSGVPVLSPMWPGLLLGTSIVFTIGLIDDIRGVIPIIKIRPRLTHAPARRPPR